MWSSLGLRHIFASLRLLSVSKGTTYSPRYSMLNSLLQNYKNMATKQSSSQTLFRQRLLRSAIWRCGGCLLLVYRSTVLKAGLLNCLVRLSIHCTFTSDLWGYIYGGTNTVKHRYTQTSDLLKRTKRLRAQIIEAMLQLEIREILISDLQYSSNSNSGRIIHLESPQFRFSLVYVYSTCTTCAACMIGSSSALRVRP